MHYFPHGNTSPGTRGGGQAVIGTCANCGMADQELDENGLCPNCATETAETEETEE